MLINKREVTVISPLRSSRYLACSINITYRWGLYKVHRRP